MTNVQLPQTFYQRDTHIVARELLGKVLVRRWRGKFLTGRICEVESYVGEDDKACHAAKGKTKRNEVMFGQAGLAYVYLIYGMHHCFNIVTEEKGFPAAVLIRGLEGVEFSFKIQRIPKEDTVEVFTPDRSNQSLNEGMRNGDIRYGLNFPDLENPQVGLPSVITE